MNDLINFIQQTLRDMWSQKLRSALALFGIIWGTLTVILLLALGTGFHNAGSKSIMQLTDGTLFAFPGVSSESYMGFPAGHKINLKTSDVMTLQKAVPNVAAVSPVLKTSTFLNYRDRQTKHELFGVSPNFAKLRKINLTDNSRFINALDIQQKSRVVIIGDKLKTRLFGENKIALGKKMQINHIPFLIVGVVKPNEENVYNWYDNKAVIPYSAYITMYGDQNVHRFIVLPNPNADAEKVEYDMRHFLSFRFHFPPDDQSALHVFNTTKIFQFFRWFFIGIQLFLGICGGLTLGVGALGVANIMFLIVTERTREIGLRMAVGACDWHVLTQILLEALTIITIGGLIGFAFSWLTVSILHFVALPAWLGQPVISDTSALITIAVLAFFGLLAGYFPAKRASQMDPVIALGLGR